jgi:hypothetical protein
MFNTRRRGIGSKNQQTQPCQLYDYTGEELERGQSKREGEEGNQDAFRKFHIEAELTSASGTS